MAFKIQNLSVLSYANGFTLWHYRTTEDNKNTVDTEGYFNTAHEMIRLNDLVIVNAVSETGMVIINKNANGVVDTANFGGIINSDSD